MKTKETSLALNSTAVENANSVSVSRTVRRKKTTDSVIIHSGRGSVKKKVSGANDNGQGAESCLLTSRIDKATPLAAQGNLATQVKAEPSAEITDRLFLDTVRDRVFEKLVAGEIKLDVGDGFKAIEIRHKISEESQNEKLLLEILGELRAEELSIGR